MSTTLKMEWWQLAAAASKSASDRCVLHTRKVAWLGPQVLDVRLDCEVCGIRGGLSRSLYQMDRGSDRCWLVGGFKLTIVFLCKVFCG